MPGGDIEKCKRLLAITSMMRHKPNEKGSSFAERESLRVREAGQADVLVLDDGAARS